MFNATECCCFWLICCVWLFCNPIDSSLPGFSLHGISQAAYWSGLPFPTPSLITREIQIKSTMRYHLMTLRMAVIRKARIISAGEPWRKGNSHTWLVGMWIDSATKKTSKKIPCSVFLFFFSVQFSSTVVSDSLRPHESQHARHPCSSQLLESTQTHVHWVGDAIRPSHPLSSTSPPALNLSQHQGLFQWVSSSHQVAKVLEFQLQHQSFQWTPRTNLL